MALQYHSQRVGAIFGPKQRDGQTATHENRRGQSLSVALGYRGPSATKRNPYYMSTRFEILKNGERVCISGNNGDGVLSVGLTYVILSC